ncbi:MAG: hypothetical protein SFU85_06690 [Candidatus Methylacidiphilales bacterium]|nr:hypothetical protein [Candidatus Methylacidiphilales bacterium]
MTLLRQFPRRTGTRGFSLVEVALSLGIVGFGILAVIGLFGAALQSNKEVVSQDESFAVTRTLPGFLKAQGFNTVFSWITSNSTMDTSATASNATVPIFAYHIDPSGSGTTQSLLEGGVHSLFIRTGSDSALATELTRRSGRLFRITLGLSPNMAIQTSGNSSYVARPTSLSGNATSYPEAALAVQVKIYEVQNTTTNVAKLKPVLTYDATVPR